MTSIVVFDYGFGNVRSMVRAVANLGVKVELTGDVDAALAADGVVVPGVGAFAACTAALKAAGGDRVVYERVKAGRPVLGVCVGLQVMFARGEEGGETTEGLGLLGGTVTHLDAPVVPHMGWDTVDVASGSRLFAGIDASERFYFVHSYGVVDPSDVAPHADVFGSDDTAKVSWCTYGNSRFVAACEKGSLSLTQFHPEKSADIGAKLLTNWLGMF